MEHKQVFALQTEADESPPPKRDERLIKLVNHLGSMQGRINIVKREFQELDRFLQETGEWIKNEQIDLLDKLEGRDSPHL
jgi:hypothetical protein